MTPDPVCVRNVVIVWAVMTVSAAAISLVSVQEEIEIGRQVNAQVRKQMPEVRDEQVVTYIRGIGRRLVSHAGGPGFPYSFSVADYREINAFALPGGPIWVNRGVLHTATNESQLAGVMAHEIAHISQRHAADQLTKATVANFGLGLLGAILGNDGGATATRVAAGFLANGLFLKFSRDDEREADRAGLQMMRKAGWDARGMVELFEVLRQESRRDPHRVEMFFSTHPSPVDRISRLQADVGQSRRGTRDSRQFQAIKGRLLRMPPPRSMPRR
jgi:predicted Zn-dependent protease